MIRVETATRYYLCCVQQDLLGDWEVLRAWGGQGTRRGSSLRQPARDQVDAQRLLDDVLRLHAAHGYMPTVAATFPPGGT